MANSLSLKKISLLIMSLVLVCFVTNALLTDTANAAGCSKSNPSICSQAECAKLGSGFAYGNPYGPGHPAVCYKTSGSGGTVTVGPCTKSTFFGLVPWYQYLTVKYEPTTKHCEVDFQASQLLGKASPILLIVFAIIDDLLRVAGMVAVVFMIIGGFKFITSSGEPEAAAGAKKTITFAIIGLVISLVAVVIVSFVGSTLGA